MTNVLHLIQTLQLGGAERNLYNLVRNMRSNTVQNHVGYCYGGEFEALFRRAGIKLFKYSDKLHKIKSLETLFAALRTVVYLRRNNIRIIHTHNFNGHVLGLIVAKLSGVKLIEHVHDFRYIEKEQREEGQSFVKQFDFIYKMKGRSDRVVVLTQQNVDFLLKNGISSSDRIRLIRNGVSMDEPFPPGDGLREKLDIPAHCAVLLTPVRISKVKNIDIFFRMVPDVLKQFPDAVFVVSGDGPMLNDYRERACREGLEKNLRFIGFYPETLELLAITNILVLPSFLELHSIAILEALSMKVPVVVSRGVGCNSEIFHQGQDALLLDPFSPDEWTEAIVGLLRDPARQRAIGEKGFILCRDHFDVRQAAVKFEELYAELVRR